MVNDRGRPPVSLDFENDRDLADNEERSPGEPASGTRDNPSDDVPRQRPKRDGSGQVGLRASGPKTAPSSSGARCILTLHGLIDTEARCSRSGMLDWRPAARGLRVTGGASPVPCSTRCSPSNSSRCSSLTPTTSGSCTRARSRAARRGLRLLGVALFADGCLGVLEELAEVGRLACRPGEQGDGVADGFVGFAAVVVDLQRRERFA